jgi:hypothetical protein
MTQRQLARRSFLRALVATSASCLAAGACAGEPETADGLKEPVYRVSKASTALPVPAERHPLDPALDMAREALTRIQRGTSDEHPRIDDYTCRIAKQERIKGELGQVEYMDAKIRNRKVVDGKLVTPLSVYLKFVHPAAVKGREVIWVEGKNNDKLRAHEGGNLGGILPSVWLDPDGAMAMRGQLHPIYDIGIENLVLKLIERGERERQFGECEVKFTPGVKIRSGRNESVCTVLEVIHPVKRPHFEFHKAEIFIDDALKVPVRYAAYFWPADPGETELPVLEMYTYTNVKLNQKLTDADFDPANPNYNF